MMDVTINLQDRVAIVADTVRITPEDDATEAGQRFLVLQLGDDATIALPGFDHDAVGEALKLSEAIRMAALRLNLQLQLRST